ncbi:MAG: sugar phosphate isomerase/epimerase [Muribaculaceae bacterium]|nr:sugar phosphate isomerase/epimerase [Muribaculaceae bacterium]
MFKSVKVLALGAIALMSLASCNISSAPEKKDVGIQLYSMRQLLEPGQAYENNLPALLDTLAKMGYTQVEAANYDNNNGTFYGLTPEEFKAAADAAGIKALSSHTGRTLSPEEIASGNTEDFYKWWDKTLADHKAAGIEYVVVPWSNVPDSLSTLKTICESYNEVGRRAAEMGLKFGYHNHSHEFQQVEGQTMLNYMIENTDPDKVFFEMDVYWTMMGHAAPVDLFNKYPGRFHLLHIKDRREIGQSGMVGFDAIFKNADKAGMENFFVEIEEFTDGAEKGAKESADYLINAPFVNAKYPVAAE